MTSALDNLTVTALPPDGQYGPAGMHGVTARHFDTAGAATLVARRGAGAALADAARVGFGLDLADGPRRSRAGTLCAIGTGPGRWLVLSEEPAELPARLAPLAAHGAMTEQGDAYVAFEVSGPRVGDLLAKGVMIDLDPSVFPPGTAATTNVAHINVTFWREEANRYVFLVGRSNRVTFARFLIASGAEYGLDFARRG